MHFYNGLSAGCKYLENNTNLPYTALRLITLHICAQYAFAAEEDARADYIHGANHYHQHYYQAGDCNDCTRIRVNSLHKWLEIVNVLYLKYDLKYAFDRKRVNLADNIWPLELFQLFVTKHKPFYQDCLGNDIFMKNGCEDLIVDVFLPFQNTMHYRHYDYHDLEIAIEFSFVTINKAWVETGWLAEGAIGFRKLRTYFEDYFEKPNIYDTTFTFEHLYDEQPVYPKIFEVRNECIEKFRLNRDFFDEFVLQLCHFESSSYPYTKYVLRCENYYCRHHQDFTKVTEHYIENILF
jgi:hypothetical protein